MSAGAVGIRAELAAVVYNYNVLGTQVVTNSSLLCAHDHTSESHACSPEALLAIRKVSSIQPPCYKYVQHPLTCWQCVRCLCTQGPRKMTVLVPDQEAGRDGAPPTFQPQDGNAHALIDRCATCQAT